MTRERLSEHGEVILYPDPASAEHGYRVRAAYADHEDPGEGETLYADLPAVASAQQCLAAALRAAADLLEGRAAGSPPFAAVRAARRFLADPVSMAMATAREARSAAVSRSCGVHLR